MRLAKRCRNDIELSKSTSFRYHVSHWVGLSCFRVQLQRWDQLLSSSSTASVTIISELLSHCFQFSDAVVELDDVAQQDIACLNVGGNPSRRKRHSTLLTQRRIESFTQDLEEGNISIWSFLRKVSWRMQGVFQYCMGLDALAAGQAFVDGPEDEDSDIDGNGKSITYLKTFEVPECPEALQCMSFYCFYSLSCAGLM